MYHADFFLTCFGIRSLSPCPSISYVRVVFCASVMTRGAVLTHIFPQHCALCARKFARFGSRTVIDTYYNHVSVLIAPTFRLLYDVACSVQTDRYLRSVFVLSFFGFARIIRCFLHCTFRHFSDVFYTFVHQSQLFRYNI